MIISQTQPRPAGGFLGNPTAVPWALKGGQGPHLLFHAHTRGFTPVMSSLKRPIDSSLSDWLEETCQDLASGWKPWVLKG